MLMKNTTKTHPPHALRGMLREYAWLGRYTVHYKKEVLWYVLTGILGTVVSLAGSILSKYIIDTVTGFRTSGIVTAVIFFILMQLLQILIRAISSRISTKVSIRVNQQITAQVYDKLLDTDWEALSAYHSGDLLTRLAGDVSTVSSSVLGWFPELFTRILQFAGTLGVILYYDATLALLALLSAPVTLLMSRYVLRMMRHHNQKMRQLTSQMTVFNEESFQNIQLIKSFDRTDAYRQKHRALQEEYRKTSMDFNRFSIHKNTILSLVGTVVAVGCFCWSVYRLWTGHITYGTMTLFLQLSATLTASFSAIAGLIPGAISAATAAGRIMALMELPGEDRSGSDAAEAFISAHGGEALSVRAQGICYSYEDGIQVLRHSDFSADPGSIVAVVGPSGEGKTTLLRLLLGIVRPKEGTLELYAENGDRVPVSANTRALFSYVPQGNTLFSGTIRENLLMIRPEATDQELQEALELACAREFVEVLPLGLDTPVREQGGGFSEGQLQRLCIARALLSQAPILLMDEATSALDMQTERKVLENIRKVQKGRTCIITTHRPSVLEISHQVYRIQDDQIKREEIR
ncbi:MAG: ABC transporter ATP-binding protein [Ruminococcaceae bacterium]|nr:ABC transporter ATP-binding protein [Oscillospiraceae bacterium]